MQTDLLRLAKHYSELSEEEFALIKREELTQSAQLAYDQETERRKSPEWKSVQRLRKRCPQKPSSMQEVIQAMVVEWFIKIFTITFGIVLFSVLGLSWAGSIPRLRRIETLPLVAGISIVLALILTFLMLVAYGAVKWLRAYLSH